jgi:hypothetical protein
VFFGQNQDLKNEGSYQILLPKINIILKIYYSVLIMLGNFSQTPPPPPDKILVASTFGVPDKIQNPKIYHDRNPSRL